LIHQQFNHALQLEVSRIELLQGCGQFYAQLWSVECVAIGENEIHAFTLLAGIITRVGRERDRDKSDSSNPATVQVGGQFAALHPGSAQEFKRSIRPASHRNIRAFNQANAGYKPASVTLRKLARIHHASP